MASHIIELLHEISILLASPPVASNLTKPSGVTSVDASPPGVWFESTISHDGLSCRWHQQLIFTSDLTDAQSG